MQATSGNRPKLVLKNQCATILLIIFVVLNTDSDCSGHYYYVPSLGLGLYYPEPRNYCSWGLTAGVPHKVGAWEVALPVPQSPKYSQQWGAQERVGLERFGDIGLAVQHSPVAQGQDHLWKVGHRVFGAQEDYSSHLQEDIGS